MRISDWSSDVCSSDLANGWRSAPTGVAAQSLGQDVAGYRLVEQVALTDITAMTTQEFQLLRCFDSFSDDLQVQLAGHGDHCRGDLHVVLVAGDVLDKAAIDLDHVDGEFLQVAQRGIPRAEVVHGQRQAERLEARSEERRVGKKG